MWVYKTEGVVQRGRAEVLREKIKKNQVFFIFFWSERRSGIFCTSLQFYQPLVIVLTVLIWFRQLEAQQNGVQKTMPKKPLRCSYRQFLEFKMQYSVKSGETGQQHNWKLKKVNVFSKIIILSYFQFVKLDNINYAIQIKLNDRKKTFISGFFSFVSQSAFFIFLPRVLFPSRISRIS